MKEMEYQAERKIEILDTGNFFGLEYYILSLGTHPTAYIKIPEGHELYRNLIDLNLHNGDTYWENYLFLSENKKINGWFIVWNYSHYNDYLGFYTEESSSNFKKWTTQEIQDEVKEVCFNIQKNYDIEQFLEFQNELRKKDEIIDLMATQLVGLSILDMDKENIVILKSEEEVKKYFEGKIEEQHKIK